MVLDQPVYSPDYLMYALPAIVMVLVPGILYFISRDKLNRVGPTRRQSVIMVSILIVTFVLSIGVIILWEYYFDYFEPLLPIIVQIMETSLILFIATCCFSAYYCAIGRKKQVDTPPQELTEYDEG